jgi:hypothetical protein
MSKYLGIEIGIHCIIILTISGFVADTRVDVKFELI